jgi:hypothetical protein
MRRAQRRKYHYIYKTTCNVTNRYYYGMHSTDNLNDGYVGSGKRLWYSINKHGIENHICEKLEYLKNREKLREREIEIVNEKLLKDPLCMNLKVGGSGGFSSKEHQLKAASAGAQAFKLKREDDLVDSKWRNSISNTMKKLYKLEKRISYFPNWTAKKHKEESKRKIGLTNSIKQKGCKNSQYGTCWITNEKENKKIKKEEIIPNGWKLGRKI